MKEEKDKVTFQFNTLIGWLIAIGATLYVFTSFTYGLSEGSWVLSLLRLGNGIGASLLSAIAVSLILEKSTLNNKIKNAFIDLLNTNFPLSGLSSSRLQRLNKKIAAARTGKTEKAIDDSLYASREPCLLAFTNGLYHNYHKSTIKIYPEEDKSRFKKVVDMEYEVINENAYDNSVRIVLMLDTPGNIPVTNWREIFKIEKFKVNKEDLLEEVDRCVTFEEIPKENGMTYKYRIIFNRKLQNCKKHKVVIRYNYFSPIDDFIQGYRVNTPCKKFDHNVIMTPGQGRSQWNIKTNAYSTHWTENPNDRLICEHRTKQNCTVRSESWILPGAGYVIYFQKEKEV